MGEANRVDEELAHLRVNYPHLEYRPDGQWVRIPSYPVPPDVWKQSSVELCFLIPQQIPGQAPYGFYVRPSLVLLSDAVVSNYAFPAPTAFGDDWGKFSWQLSEWTPTSTVVGGTNMVNFARSVADRLREGA